ARERLRNAVTAFDHARIFTIHGYCHRVLIEDAFAARRLFDQTQVVDEVAFYAAFTSQLRERFARIQPDRELIAAYLESERTVDDLRKMLLQCARADATVRQRFDPDGLRAGLAPLFELFGTTTRRAQTIAGLKLNANERTWMDSWLASVGRQLERSDPNAPAPQLAMIRDEVRVPLEKTLKYFASSDRHTHVVSAIRTALRTTSLDEAIVSELLPQLHARIGSDKAERGLFDYDDMLELVWDALRGPRGGELAARLRERTPWAMIDEFQDTDPIQWSIFRTVWMHAGAKSLTIVGDPKQAIYGFRGADVETYRKAREEMLRAGATRVVLDVNHRATEPMVHAVNHLLIGNPFQPLLDKSIRYDDPVRASGSVVTEDSQPPVTVLALQSPLSADPTRAALGDAIGRAIDELRAAPPAWSRGGVVQPFALGQIMVLTRTNTESSEIAAMLRRRGLPCAVVEPEKLFATREAYELATLLAAIAAPRDRSARVRALRTRFFDVRWEDLMRVVDGPDHHPQIAMLFDWARLAAQRGYESLFRRIIEDSGYAERSLVLGDGERALTNTWHLIELLLGELSRSRCDLHELVVQLRRWMMDDTATDDRDVQRAETDGDAIRILTIHKAKGLEAPYVFLFGGASGGPSSKVRTLPAADGRTLVLGDPDDVTSQALEDEAVAENQRLAYVAVTRAQVRLYLPSYLALKGSPAYAPIQRCLTAVLADPQATALFQSVAIATDARSLPAPPPDALAALAAPLPPPPREIAPLDATRSGLAMVSYTRLAKTLEAATLTGRSDARAIDPAEFDLDDAGGVVAADELPPGAGSGSFLHEVLELVDLDEVRRAPDLDAWSKLPAVQAQLASSARAWGIDPRYLPHAATLVYRTLTQPLALTDGYTLPAMSNAAAVTREIEFSYPLPALEPGAPLRGLVKGFIDALIAWDDQLWILDYKSDLLGGSDLAAAAVQRANDHYAVQARLYAIAADRMRGRRRLAGALFAFIRYGVVVPVRVEPTTVESWTRWLAGLPIQEARR
ncbi:MAG: UvrD-helicase domain-containing protein, partial [Kofleriaceae bacterium]